MRNLTIARAALLACLPLMGTAAYGAPFPMNGWQFHEYDIPKLSEAIQKAPEYGVNFFIFSHGLFDRVEAFLDSSGFQRGLYRRSPEFIPSADRQRDVLRLGALADRQHIPWYLWVHEFDDIPDRFRVPGRVEDPVFLRAVSHSGSGTWVLKKTRVNLDDPALLEYLRQRYERLLAVCPNTAGFVLTLHETDEKLFRNSEVASKLSIPDRIYTISKLVYDVLKKHNKKLIVRNFFYEPKEVEYFAEALSRLPDDVIVMSKPTPHEFHPFYPPDPMEGKTGKKLHIMEMDLGVEKALSGEGPYAQTGYIRRDVLRLREKGMAGAVGRARMIGDRPFEDTHEVNLYAFSRFLKDPDLSVDTVLQDWAKRRGYPAEAVPSIASAMKRTEFIHHAGRWPLGWWMTRGVGGDWGDYYFYFGHTLLRSRYKWTHDPADKKLEQGLINPDRELFAKLLAERDEVIRQVRAGAADLRAASRYLTGAQREPLEEGFRFLADAAELQKQWVRAYFGMRMWMQQPNAENEAIVQDALAKLDEMDRMPGVPWGYSGRGGRSGGHRYSIGKFILEMRWRMANRQTAMEQDQHILEEMTRLQDVEKN